jgi:lipid-binding SYLF domain-containing protein
MGITRKALCWLPVLLLVAASQATAASRNEATAQLEDFHRYFVEFQRAPDKAIPEELLAQCHGVIIMRQYKAGFVVGAKIAHGVIIMHDRYTGQWSAPAFVRSAEGSFGFQAGGQAIDAIMLIMNQAGVDMLLKTRFTLGVDASVAVGPVGRDMSGDVGLGAALLSYSRTKGLFAGVSFEGGGWINNNEYNFALYGQPVGLRDILIDRAVPIPAEARPMLAALREYAAPPPSAPAYNYGYEYAPASQRRDAF